MGAVEALLAKAEFTDAFTGATPNGREHLYRMAEAFFEEDAGGSLPTFHADPDALVSAWERQLAVAEAFYVAPAMCDVVGAAAPTMPAEDLVPEDLPTSHGFVLIPGGVGQINSYGRLMVIHAVVWASYGGGVDLLMLSDKRDLRDFYNAEMHGDPDQAAQFASVPRYLPNSLMRLKYGEPLPTLQTFASTLPPHIHVEQHERPDGSAELHLLREDGTPAHDDDVPDLDFGDHPEPVCRWVVAMWRFMQQSLAAVDQEAPPRPLRRQLARRNVEDRHVSVVTLRRMTRPTSGEREVQWTHRWIRRGHWRQQPYKVDGEWTRRAIWIHPTICGPDDKPLLVRGRVYALRR